MAKRQKKTEKTDVERFELDQTKVSNELQKNARALERMFSNQEKTITENLEKLEQIRFEFTLEERRMQEARDQHKESMEELEAKTKENAETMLQEAKEQAEELVESATTERNRIVNEKNDAIKKLTSEYEWKKTQEERLYKEFVLGNKKEALSQLLEEFNLARIDSEKLEDLQRAVNKSNEQHQMELEEAIADITTNLKKDHEIELIQLKSKHSSEVAKFEPQIAALKQEIKRLESQVENYKEMMDENRKAQVQMTANMRHDVHINSDSGKK